VRSLVPARPRHGAAGSTRAAGVRSATALPPEGGWKEALLGELIVTFSSNPQAASDQPLAPGGTREDAPLERRAEHVRRRWRGPRLARTHTARRRGTPVVVACSPCQWCCGTSSWTIWGGGHRFVVACRYTVCCGTSSWTIWGGGHRFVVASQYTVCCSTSSWTIWGGGHRFVVACQYTVCCGTSSWTIWGGGHRFVVASQYTVCCSTSCWTIWGGGHRFVVACQYTVCCSTSYWTIRGNSVLDSALSSALINA
jgi:hypothetical protein